MMKKASDDIEQAITSDKFETAQLSNAKNVVLAYRTDKDACSKALEVYTKR